MCMPDKIHLEPALQKEQQSSQNPRTTLQLVEANDPPRTPQYLRYEHRLPEYFTPTVRH